MTVMGMAWPTPGPDASPVEVVKAMRAQALSLEVFADVLSEFDKAGAALTREDAILLRCQAAVVEQLAELHEALSMEAQALTKLLGGTA